MASNVNITPGIGDVVAAEDISSVKYQLVKLVNSTASSTTRTGVAADPLQVSLANHAANATAVKVDGSAVTQPVSMATNTPLGTVAHDAADSGAPLKIGAKAETSPAGITTVADGDRTDLYADGDGLIMTKPLTSYGDILVERVSNTDGNSTALTVFGATANARNYITTVVAYNSSSTAGYVDLRDGTAGSVLFTIPLPATGGTAISFPVPLRQTTASAPLAFDVSGALTTVYISLIGFKSKL